MLADSSVSDNKRTDSPLSTERTICSLIITNSRVATYCLSRPSELTKENTTKYGERGDVQVCSGMQSDKA